MSGSWGVAAVKAAWSTGRNLDSTNPVSIQESIDQLDQIQVQVRIRLFRQLQRLATQPGEGLGQALSQLEAQADKVIPDSHEASMLPHIGTYREIISRIQELTREVSRKQAAEDVQKQAQEFDDRLAAGSLSDAAYCCVQLEKMAQDAEEELAEQAARRQQQLAEEGEGEAGAARDGSGDGGGVEGVGEGQHAGGLPRVTVESVALLQEASERCSTKLKETLEACCSEAVIVDTQGSRVVVRAVLRGGSVRVPDLFSALQVLGLQQLHLRRITDRLVSGALEPMLTSPCCVTITAATEPGGAATLAWTPAPPGSTGMTSGAGGTARLLRPHGSGGGGGGGGGPCDPEHCCQHLLRLLATWFLEFDEGLMELFGGPFWRAAADCYIAHVARPFIAANPEDVEGCEAVVAAAADLEAMAGSLNITNEADPYLAPAVETLARHALSSRQEKYLERARQLLVEGSGGPHAAPGGGGSGGDGAGSVWETVVAGQALQVDEEYYRRLVAGEMQDWEAQDPPSGCRTDGPVLATGRYLITRRTSDLVQLLTGLMQDACAGSRALSRALLSAVSSIALMARTLPPLAAAATAAGAATAAAAAEQSLAAVPQLGLLAVTDLQHLATTLMVLPQAYGAALEVATGEEVGRMLLGEALQLRAAARARMQAQLRIQYGSLDEILAGLDGLHTVGHADAKAGQRHRRVIHQLLHSLGRLGRAASEVLTPDDAVAMGAAVLNYVGGQIVAAVMAKGDIGHDESVELAELLAPLADGAVDAWLPAASATGPDLSGIPLGVVRSALEARGSQIRKLQCVLQVLRSDTLAHIEQMWDSGDLAMLAAPELEHLLLAISENSPGRRALLEKLRN
ncbi:hypothetical protein VaNZ11_013030 [Volvox africanus]|uniref:Uncharacterized protein n=1 Tax=Volvox africanus TaxID=51714 RepID=A0ABQ5SFL1_9CHLO|nr:hypothetical protein VaNZ11_013030 [Volvox africanus]